MKKYLISLLLCAYTFFAYAEIRYEFASYDHLFIFPHQVAVADAIFTGTAITNADEYTTQFAIEETLWGYIPTSNILIRCIRNTDKTSFALNDKYLVFAYTNNWWSGTESYRHIELEDISVALLSDFMSPTNRPNNNSTFADYRIIDNDMSVINFDKLICDGTNYWQDTRTFITNFLEISRIKNDEVMAFRKINSIIRNQQQSQNFPEWLRFDLKRYNYFRYHCVEPNPAQLNNR